MKNAGKLITPLLFLLTGFFILQACDNENDKLRLLQDVEYDGMSTYQETVSELTLTNVSSINLTIEGGNLPYAATSRDTTVAQSYVVGNNLRIDGLNEGETEILVTDSHQEFILLKISVTQKSDGAHIVGTYAKIEGVDTESEQYTEIQNCILTDMAARYKTDMEMIILYERCDNYYTCGRLFVYESENDEEPIEGNFVHTYNEEHSRMEFSFEWNDQVDVFYLPISLNRTLEQPGPQQAILVTDISEQFSILHPEYSDVTSALFGIQIVLF